MKHFVSKQLICFFLLGFSIVYGADELQPVNELTVEENNQVMRLKNLTAKELKIASQAEQNMSLVLRLCEETNGDVIDQYFAPTIKVHELATGQEETLSSIKQFNVLWAKAFEQKKLVINDIFATDDKVFLYWTWYAVHNKGEWKGIAATHKEISLQGMTIYQITEGKISEMTQLWDNLKILEQIGKVSISPEIVSP